MALSPSPTSSTSFARFDVVSDDPSDHFFFARSNSTAPPTCLIQEWKRLEAHLPSSIFVRVFERRISLLRAAIVGAPGTLYQDGLFVFDLFFPSDYPIQAPKVQYRSFGFQISPNIRENGQVCLSSLENWAKQRDSLLHLLVSMKALVGHGFLSDELSWGCEERVAESALCCRSALCLLRKRPATMESLVVAHFRERAVAVLTACDVSDNIYADLVKALHKNGAPLEQFIKRMVCKKEVTTSATSVFHSGPMPPSVTGELGAWLNCNKEMHLLANAMEGKDMEKPKPKKKPQPKTVELYYWKM